MDPVFSYLLDLSKKNLDLRKKSVDAVNTKEQFLARQLYLKEQLKRMIGIKSDSPDTRLKIKAEIKGVITYDTYVIEKIILEPEPNYFIPVNLYRPTKITEPIPAVLTPVGHYNEGKSVEPYQIICTSLAQKGCISLIFDPIGQGERDMLDATENIDDYYCVLQHSLAGNLAYLLDLSISHFFIQDCIYALDYLLQREDVDKNRIGCVGHSGGGTATAFLTSIDDRVKAGMSVHFITKYAAIIESALHGGDPDQSLFGLLSSGFDMDDYILMSLPRAFAINAGIKDYFPIDGSREVYRDTMKYYKMFGISDKLSIVEVDCGHELNPEVRKNIYKWANEQFNTALDFYEQKTEILSAENLACFKYKSAHTFKGLTPFDIYNRKNIEYASSREEYLDKYYNYSYDVFVNEVCLKLKSLLSLDASNAKSEIEASKKEFSDESCLVQYKIHLSEKRESTRPLIFAIDFEDILKEGSEFLNNLLIKGFNVAIVKPIGFDITKNSPITKQHIYNDDYKITYHAFINGKSIMGMRVQNCLNIISSQEVDSLATNGIVFLGSGPGGLIGTLLSPFCSKIVSLVTIKSLASYSLLFENKNYVTYPSNIINGIMKHFDISTIAACLAPKKQLILYAVDEMNEIISEDKIHRLYEFTSEVYSALNKKDNLKIVCDSNYSTENISKHIMNFLI